MVSDNDIRDNPIHHSKELHDMLLEGYRHAIVVDCPDVKEIIETASDGSGDSGGSGKPKNSGLLTRKLELKLTPADVIYEFGKESSSIWVEGFVDKETARMAHQERLELLNRADFDRKEQEERVRLLDLKQHLKPELK